ncbi:uncharacterized [Tachysurus ichikawai]
MCLRKDDSMSRVKSALEILQFNGNREKRLLMPLHILLVFIQRSVRFGRTALRFASNVHDYSHRKDGRKRQVHVEEGTVPSALVQEVWTVLSSEFSKRWDNINTAEHDITPQTAG